MDIELKIEKIAFGGEGLGFINGKVCFVENTIPGEKILARLVTEKPNYSKAKLIRVIEPSPLRVRPACPYIERCGGCQYQHLSYAEELSQKESQVRESFTHTFKIPESHITPIQSASKEFGYRNSITLHRTNERNNHPQRLGFIAHDNYSKVLIDYCLLADELLRPIFTSEHRLRRQEEKRGFKLDEKGRIFSSDEEKLYRVAVGGKSIWSSSLGFFQNNISATELIAKSLEENLREIKPERFLDLYSGVGTFSLLSAAFVPEVDCFEESPYSMGCLRRNFRSFDEDQVNSSKQQVGVFTGKVEKTFPKFISQKPKPGTVIFMDPPRLGIASSLANFLAKEESCGNLFYLACDLQILIRDLRLILSQGKWQIARVAPFDMFPRTKHIEVLVELKKT